MAAIPALRELARASRSAERLFDTLYRELPPTLESIRLTGSEISDLTDDLSEGVESAGNVVKPSQSLLKSSSRVGLVPLLKPPMTQLLRRQREIQIYPKSGLLQPSNRTPLLMSQSHRLYP
jgi:hypothetical protein